MGCTQNNYLIEISKEIWGYLIERKTHLTAEYIPSLSNQTADWESRKFQIQFSYQSYPKVLLSLEGKIHPLIQSSSLRLVTWLVSSKIYFQKEYQKGLSTLSQIPKGQVFSQITNRPGESRLAGAIGSKLISLVTI